jgi:GT2 family glycosyltransferase
LYLEKDAEIAVIVITYNGKQHLEECIEALLKQTSENFTIYLIDNASTDGSSLFVSKKYPQVKVIQHEKNYGFAEGYNRAIKYVNSKYIALLNDDTKVDPKWLEELTKAIKQDSKIFAVGSKIFFYTHPTLLQNAGVKPTLIGTGIDVGYGSQDIPEYNQMKPVGAVCGGAMMLRRKIFGELGGFDSRYFAYFEDVDLCWRGWLQGYKTLYVPTAKVFHKFGGSWGGPNSYNRIYYGTKNRYANMIKNLGVKNLLLAFYVSFIFDYLRGFSFSLKKQNKNVLSMFQAYYRVFQLLPTYVSTRISIQKRRILSDNDLLKTGLLSTLPESLSEFRRLKTLDLSFQRKVKPGFM